LCHRNHVDDSGKEKFIAVLGEGAVNSPEAAVRAWIVKTFLSGAE
jgi:hypothetical protein